METTSTQQFTATVVLPPPPAVPLLDLHKQHTGLRDAIRTAVDRVIDSGRFVLGPDCEELERSIGRMTSSAHALGCASGSDALLLGLMACGIGPGDEVIMPSYTFFATAGAVSRLGATPVFVDIDPSTYNLNPALIEKLITPATKAIIPVHLFGQCADMEAIGRVASRHSLAVIEDACQAIGAEYDRRPAGSMGDVGCFSFYPTKNLGGFGDGGMITTQRDDLASKMKLMRVHGMEPRYYHKLVGINSRLDSIQAAVLNVKLPHLKRWSELRRANAERYAELFANCGLDRVLGLPQVASRCKHVWNQYVVRVPDGRRDALRKHLTEVNIGSEVYYPLCLHQQECFKDVAYVPGSLVESERAAIETVALPIFPELTADQQRVVVSRIADFFAAPGYSGKQALRKPRYLESATGKRESIRPKSY